MSDHDFPDAEIAHNVYLKNVDPNLLESTLQKELKFNPNYYRIHTPQEIIEAEAEASAAVAEESKD